MKKDRDAWTLAIARLKGSFLTRSSTCVSIFKTHKLIKYSHESWTCSTTCIIVSYFRCWSNCCCTSFCTWWKSLNFQITKSPKDWMSQMKYTEGPFGWTDLLMSRNFVQSTSKVKSGFCSFCYNHLRLKKRTFRTTRLFCWKPSFKFRNKS